MSTFGGAGLTWSDLLKTTPFKKLEAPVVVVVTLSTHILWYLYKPLALNANNVG